MQYEIQRNGRKIGSLNFQKRQAGGRTTYNVASEVRVNMLVSVVVKAREQSVYENEVLQSSSVIRHVNGRQKANKQIRKKGSGLIINDDGEEQVLKNFLVRFSSHCLYATEPVTSTSVFCDNYKKFIPLEKLADHRYRLTFPDGNSNEYYYENGVCKRVRVKNQLFDADFVLTSP